MDRTNLGIAVVAGMGVDLKLIGFRYSTIVLVFFITYVFLQPPATVILRKVGPRVFLPTICILWGVTMITFGFLKTWTQMIPLRLVLGIFEAGFFPGCAYLLSCWYPRYDLQKRYAVFYLIGSLSSAFSGILAYGFFQMNGLGDLGKDYGQHYGPTKANPTLKPGVMEGIAGWRWIFIMQGLITCVVAVIGAFTIADFPENAANKSKSFALSFLNQKEANFIVARIQKDREDAIAEPFHLSTYLRCGLDSKIWGFAALFGLTTTTTYAIAYFLPIILHEGMGFDTAMAECLIAPPYVVAAIWMVSSSLPRHSHQFIEANMISSSAVPGTETSTTSVAQSSSSTQSSASSVSPCSASPPTLVSATSVSSSPPPLATPTFHQSSLSKPTTSVDSGSVLSPPPHSSELEVSVVLLDRPSSDLRTSQATSQVSTLL